MTDEEMLRQLRAGNPDSAIAVLYKEFPKVLRLIKASGGDEAEARATFHDALLIVSEKAYDPRFVLSCRLTTYLYSVSRLLSNNQIRKKNNRKEVEWPDALVLSDEEIGTDDVNEPLIDTMEKVLGRLSERCREILTRFYLRGQSMSEIADALGFSSINSTKTQKYKCIERAINLAAEPRNKTIVS